MGFTVKLVYNSSGGGVTFSTPTHLAYLRAPLFFPSSLITPTPSLAIPRLPLCSFRMQLGDLDPSVELLQQSGCGKAVSSVRKHFFGGQVKHNDKDVATAASSLRTRWMDALGKSPASAATAPGGTPTVVAAGASSVDTKPAPLSQVPAFSRARSDSNQHQSSSKKKNASAARRSGDESPRVRSPKTEWRLGVGKESKGRENGGGRGSGSGDAGGSDVGGRYGSSVQHGEEKGSGGGVVGKKVLKKEIKKEVKKEMAAPAAAKMPPIVSMDEVRERAGIVDIAGLWDRLFGAYLYPGKCR